MWPKPCRTFHPWCLCIKTRCLFVMSLHHRNRTCVYLIDSRVKIEVDLTHWGQMTHICVGKLITIVSDNGLSPGRHQAVIETNAGILLIGPLGTNLSELLIGIKTFSFKKMHLKMSSAKWRLFCLGLSVLNSNQSPLLTILSLLNCTILRRIYDSLGVQLTANNAEWFINWYCKPFWKGECNVLFQGHLPCYWLWWNKVLLGYFLLLENVGFVQHVIQIVRNKND